MSATILVYMSPSVDLKTAVTHFVDMMGYSLLVYISV